MALNSAVSSFSGLQNSMTDIQPLIDYMANEQTRTNAYNSAEAAEQRRWQADQASLERAFNSEEAAKNRDWQEMMSNTAHQREVADLRAAGLNPVLSASGGNGAAVGSGSAASQTGIPSGSKGSAGNVNGALVSLFGTLLDNQTKLMMNMSSGAQVNSYYDTQMALAMLRREWELEDRDYTEDWYQRRTDIDTAHTKDINATKPGSGFIAGLLQQFHSELDHSNEHNLGNGFWNFITPIAQNIWNGIKNISFSDINNPYVWNGSSSSASSEVHTGDFIPLASSYSRWSNRRRSSSQSSRSGGHF